MRDLHRHLDSFGPSREWDDFIAGYNLRFRYASVVSFVAYGVSDSQESFLAFSVDNIRYISPFLAASPKQIFLAKILFDAVGFCFHKVIWCATVLGSEGLKVLKDPSSCIESSRSCTQDFSLLIVCVWMVPILFIASSEADDERVSNDFP